MTEMTYTGVLLGGNVNLSVEQVRKAMEPKLPCGERVTFAHVKQKRSIPCPCGDPKHWLVRVQK